MYGFAPAALLVGMLARGRARLLAARVDDLERELRRRCEGLSSAVDTELGKQRTLLARVAGGEAIDAEMIREGRLWRELSPEQGKALFDELGAELLLLDVRTPAEQSGGVIPGARLLPLDELEERIAELPRDGRRVLVYCAGGGRSAAACEFLSHEGIGGLHNLAGGISAWPGPVKRP